MKVTEQIPEQDDRLANTQTNTDTHIQQIDRRKASLKLVPFPSPVASASLFVSLYTYILLQTFIPCTPCRRLPQNELENVAGEREVWVSLLGLLPPRPHPGISGWQWMENTIGQWSRPVEGENVMFIFCHLHNVFLMVLIWHMFLEIVVSLSNIDHYYMYL